jgi:hypothetical protein
MNKAEDKECVVCDPISRKVFYFKLILLNTYFFFLLLLSCDGG